jgi:hypothetical protein
MEKCSKGALKLYYATLKENSVQNGQYVAKFVIVHIIKSKNPSN